jgi:hypothetical protein
VRRVACDHVYAGIGGRRLDVSIRGIIPVILGCSRVHLGSGLPRNVSNHARTSNLQSKYGNNSPSSLTLSQIGRVERSFDPYVSRFSPGLCINDIAISKLDVPIYINNFRPLRWLKTMERDRPLFLAGLEKQGVAKAEKRWVAEAIQGALGGWRYMIHLGTHGRLPDYQDGAVLLWRSKELSVRGCSGAMIVMPGDKLDNGYYHEWIAVAFQSHEFSENVFKDQEEGPDCWKVGYQAPAELKAEFWAVMGNQLLHLLDMQYSAMKK